MRDWSYVFDQVNFKTSSLQRADRCFTACAWSFNHNLNGFHPMFHCSFGSSLSSHLCSKRSRFTGTSESEAAGACPRNCISVRIRNSNDSVIESGTDMRHARFNILTVTTFSTYDFFGLAIFSYPPYYFFLFATVRRGPLRVRAFVFVRCPRTGRPRR